MKTWLITGASRGFGLRIARLALEQGDNVVATARRAQAERRDGHWRTAYLIGDQP